jgi:hypothetical protein
MKCIAFLFLASLAFASNAADNELKLRIIYKQHAEADEEIGKHLVAFADRRCADLHATAAEDILKTPTRAASISKATERTCEKEIKYAEEQEIVTAHEKILASCEELSEDGKNLPPGLKDSCDAAADWLSDHGYKCFKDGHCEKQPRAAASRKSP